MDKSSVILDTLFLTVATNSSPLDIGSVAGCGHSTATAVESQSAAGAVGVIARAHSRCWGAELDGAAQAVGVATGAKCGWCGVWLLGTARDARAGGDEVDV